MATNKLALNSKLAKHKPAKNSKATDKKSHAPKALIGRETAVAKKERSLKICSLLKKYYPDAKCSLNFETPFQLLIATMLSAQCTDARVNIVTPILFAELPDPKVMARVAVARLEHLVKSTGFYRNKAKNIKACSQKLLDDCGGEVPKTMHELYALPGVGRKTANCVLGNAFGIPGMVVDTHVTRLTNRLGLTAGTDAVKLESDLEKLVPKKDWTQFSHWLISHGRAVCVARSPKCEICFLNQLCPRRGI